MEAAIILAVGAFALMVGTSKPKAPTTPAQAAAEQSDFSGFTLAQLSPTRSGLDNTPPPEVYGALRETAARLRLTLDVYPSLVLTSCYRSHEVTAKIWPYYAQGKYPPAWDWHEKGHAVDLSGPRSDMEACLEWSRGGVWSGADTQAEYSANHIHLAWA